MKSTELLWDFRTINKVIILLLLSFPSDSFILTLQILMVILDSLLVMTCIVSYCFLLSFTIKQKRNKTLRSISKRNQKLQKFAIRMCVIIMSTVFTWVPVLVIQSLVLLQVPVLPQIYFWCVLVTFPVNLIVDPILLIRNMLV